jgi:hypothetical protein
MAANKPIATFKLGRIQAAVWENHGENGAFCNVTIQRSYLDDDEWKSSTSFGRLDLPLVAKVAELAMTFIYNRPQQTRAF